MGITEASRKTTALCSQLIRMASVANLQTKKSVCIALPPIAATEDTGSEAPASPLKRRRARKATRPGEHYSKYPGWFCSPSCGPHCCGAMSESLKDQYLNEIPRPSSIPATHGDKLASDHARTSARIQREPAK